MEPLDQTLHDFVLNLLSDPESLSAFQADPEGALGSAGLSDITPADVHEVLPLVSDLAPVPALEGLASMDAVPDSPQAGTADAIQQLQYVTQALEGHVSYGGAATPDGHVAYGTALTDPLLTTQGVAAVGGDLLGNLTSDLGLNSELGGLDSTLGLSPQGQVTNGEQVANPQAGVAGATALAGDLQGLLDSVNLATPLGNLSATGSTAATTGQFSVADQFDNQALHTQGATSLGGDLINGMSFSGSFDTPSGEQGFSHSLPGLSELTGLDSTGTDFTQAYDPTDTIDGQAYENQVESLTNATLSEAGVATDGASPSAALGGESFGAEDFGAQGLSTQGLSTDALGGDSLTNGGLSTTSLVGDLLGNDLVGNLLATPESLLSGVAGGPLNLLGLPLAPAAAAPEAADTAAGATPEQTQAAGASPLDLVSGVAGGPLDLLSGVTGGGSPLGLVSGVAGSVLGLGGLDNLLPLGTAAPAAAPEAADTANHTQAAASPLGSATGVPSEVGSLTDQVHLSPVSDVLGSGSPLSLLSGGEGVGDVVSHSPLGDVTSLGGVGDLTGLSEQAGGTTDLTHLATPTDDSFHLPL